MEGGVGRELRRVMGRWAGEEVVEKKGGGLVWGMPKDVT